MGPHGLLRRHVDVGPEIGVGRIWLVADAGEVLSLEGAGCRSVAGRSVRQGAVGVIIVVLEREAFLADLPLALGSNLLDDGHWQPHPLLVSLARDHRPVSGYEGQTR